MNNTLKAVGSIGAELGAVKAENEKLRKALKRIIDRCEAFVDDEAEMRTPSVEVLMGIAEDAIYTVHLADAALSLQAEPVEPAPAQDEREASRSVEPIVRALNASVAVGSDGDWVSIRREHRDAAVRMLSDLDADFRHVYQAYVEAQKRANRPAQTEQQPVAIANKGEHAFWVKWTDEGRSLRGPGIKLYAAPIAQTAPQPEQSEDNRRTLQWAVDRWHAEVANRPLVNVHRRTLDGTWRQIIRHLGEDDVVLLGPRHDDMLDASGNPLPQYVAQRGDA